MSKRVIVVVLACVALAAPALVALAASPRISTEETFTVTEETYYNQQLETAEDGSLIAGTEVVYRSRLLDPNTDEKVGVDVANCLANSSGRVVCTGYFQINDRGQIWTQWVQDLRSPEGYVMAISGGTGEFANVRGKVTAPEAGASVDLTFDLLP